MLGIAIGDLHLDALTKYWSNANYLQAEAVLQAASAGVKKSGAKRITLLGDIAEGIKDSTGAFVRLSETGQEVFLDLLLELQQLAEVDIICGNHDFSSVGNTALNLFERLCKHRLLKRVNIYTKPVVKEVEGVKVAYLPHPYTELPEPGCHLAFAHFEVAGAASDSGRVMKDGYTPKGKTPFIQGHLHTKQKVRNHYYPGTLYQLNFGERLPKFYGIYHVTPDSRMTMEAVQVNPPFKLLNVQITSPKDFAKISTDPRTLYKLFLQDEVDLPNSFLADHPNIVNAFEYKTEQELQDLQQACLDLTESSVDLSIEDTLPDALKNQGLTEAQVEQALLLHKHLVGQV